MNRRRRIWALLAAAFIVLVVGTIGWLWERSLQARPRAEPAASPTASSPPPNPLNDESLQDWVASCDKSVNQWRQAQVVWPASLDLSLGQAVTYHASANAMTSPVPPDEAFGPSPATTHAVVRCVLGTRLRSVDDGLQVQVVGADEDGWRYQRFGPGGTLEWTWTITGIGLGDHQLNLEIRPVAQVLSDAQVAGGESYEISSIERTTQVHVTGDVIQHLSYWFTKEGGLLTTIGAAALAGLIWLLSATGQLKKAWRQAFPKSRRTTRPPARSAKSAEEPLEPKVDPPPPAAKPRKRSTRTAAAKKQAEQQAQKK